MLRAHTARCVPCAQFQSEAVAITHKLRLTPLEPLPAPIALPPRRRVVGPVAAGRCRRRRRRARGRDRGFALDLTAADEPHRTRGAAHLVAALGRLPRRAAGPAAAPAARVPVARRARSGPHRHLTSGRAPGRSPPCRPERGDCRGTPRPAPQRQRRHPRSASPSAGTAAGRFNDVERWVLLSSNECYLRRLRDQKTSLSWNLSFSGGRSLADGGSCDGEGGRERHRGA